MSEIVYVLGSGFSVCGGAPTQKDILPFLFSEDFREIGEHKKRIGRFLKDVFFINISNIADLKQFPLEDLFTVLDRTILNQGAFRKYGKSEVDELRKSLGICINFVISNALRSSTQSCGASLHCYRKRRWHRLVRWIKNWRPAHRVDRCTAFRMG